MGDGDGVDEQVRRLAGRAVQARAVPFPADHVQVGVVGRELGIVGWEGERRGQFGRAVQGLDFGVPMDEAADPVVAVPQVEVQVLVGQHLLDQRGHRLGHGGGRWRRGGCGLGHGGGR